jgi:fructose-bisphosphate aldolase class II
MTVVPICQILDRAFAEHYGVAAINVVDDLTLEAVLAAATELESPLILSWRESGWRVRAPRPTGS